MYQQILIFFPQNDYNQVLNSQQGVFLLAVAVAVVVVRFVPFIFFVA
jgi:hypothetical protein